MTATHAFARPTFPLAEGFVAGRRTPTLRGAAHSNRAGKRESNVARLAQRMIARRTTRAHRQLATDYPHLLLRVEAEQETGIDGSHGLDLPR